METIDRNRYGAMEINGLVNGTDYHSSRSGQARMSLKKFAHHGGRVTRLRYFAERRGPGEVIYDVSYVHGALPNGAPVELIGAPLGEIGRPRGFKTILVNWAKQEGVFAKAVGLLDETKWSTVG